jgi:GDP-mannose 6-dehydrogenase
MRVCVFGLGYVGCVSVACLAKDDVDVVGIDTSPTKVRQLNAGEPTVIEQGVAELIRDAHARGRLSAVTAPAGHVAGSDASIICVGTPSKRTGELDVSRVLEVAGAIGRDLAASTGFHTVLIRSTVVPGTGGRVSEIVARESGRRPGEGFAVVSYPEFLREGTAVADYYNPPFVVAGTDSERALAVVREINREVNATVVRTSIGTAEMIKMVSNSFHALKVAFANEVGNICKQEGVDSHELMDLFCKDRKLNIAPYYLRPGFAYGGSCLPKDLMALQTLSRLGSVETPVLEAVSRSNELQKQRLLDILADIGSRKVGLLGLSFKPGTDDLRSSPMVEVAERMLGKGYELLIYDRNVHLSNLVGTNREYIAAHIPHLKELITDDLQRVIDESEVLVVAHNERSIRDAVAARRGKTVIDLVGLGEHNSMDGQYHGISW